MDRCALFVDAGYALADGAMAVHGTRRRDSVSWDHAGLLKLLAGLARDRTGLPVLRCYWYETAEGRRTPEHDALAEMPGLTLSLGLAAFAAASVAWWSFTGLHGPGDLRPYLLLQGAPLVLIPLWQWIDDSPRAERIAIAVAIGLYALAKAAELADHAVYDAVGFVSGHTIKHLLAAAASAVLVAHIDSRAKGACAGPVPRAA